MLSNPLQYSPQSLTPQFAGLSQQLPFGLSQQLPFGEQANPFLGSFAGHAGASIPVQHIVPLLGQLAQQIAVQSAVAQQIGAAIHQLAHQLALQGLQGQGPQGQGLQAYAGGNFGAGQFAGAGQPYPGGAGQPFGLSGQGGYGGYGGFNPQAQGWAGQAWGARPQTVQ
jgi:hypothetical protein